MLPLPCMLVCPFVCANRTRDRGCSKHPVFPAPSKQEGGKFTSKPRTQCAARTRSRIQFVARMSEARSGTTLTPPRISLRSSGLQATSWIASRSLSSGAHSRDPLARNDGQGAMPLVQHPTPIGAVQRERRHVDLEPLAACVDHLVAPGHEARCGLQRHSAGVFEALARREHGLLADHALAADFLL